MDPPAILLGKSSWQRRVASGTPERGRSSMPRFSSFDGIEIAYQEWGGDSMTRLVPPVFLHRGFISDANLNWVRPQVTEALSRAGRRVVALHARGRGASRRPH